MESYLDVRYDVKIYQPIKMARISGGRLSRSSPLPGRGDCRRTDSALQQLGIS